MKAKERHIDRSTRRERHKKDKIKKKRKKTGESRKVNIIKSSHEGAEGQTHYRKADRQTGR